MFLITILSRAIQDRNHHIIVTHMGTEWDIRFVYDNDGELIDVIVNDEVRVAPSVGAILDYVTPKW